MLIPNEIGTLRAQPNGESLFVGSSSGVFFINTVRRAFSHAAATAPPSPQRNANDNVSSARTLASLPSPEDCILGSDPPTKESWFPSNIEDLGSLPDHAAAKELLITYFRTWHPLFPFLHGPTCLEDLESLYVGGQAIKPKSLSTAIIFQCLFSIAKLDRPEITSLGKSQIRSQRQLMLALSMISLNCDLVSTQALLAGQLYFVAIMDLRAASTAGGLVLQSMFKSGLHRCPFRYLSLKDDTREMRKRVFWSAYTLDRFVSQSLGHPLGIRDDDFDVCAPGDNDLHQPVRSTDGNHEGTTPKETILHLPANHPGRHGGSTCSSSDAHEHREEPATPAEEERPQDASPNRPGFENDQTSQRRRENQSIQAQFVRFSQLVGRMVEMFHKSIHARTASRHNILFLKADVDAWGNSLPYISTSTSARGSNPQTASFDQDIFFSVARQQLLLLVNRPSLSLDPTSAEFCHAAQICIGAARAIIRTLESHIDSGGLLFWPGFINAVWMSGLVMAFTCQLKLHSMTNAISDISASLKVLRTMTRRWRMTRNCCDVLSMLLENIQTPKASDIASANAFNQSLRTPRGHKRTREDT
ncbi:fungal-specific transcription factor domain-containing protein, partial [Paraphoma chrysanthemicola]